MSPGGIPLVEILAYCLIHDIDNAQDMAHSLNALDEALFEYIAEKEASKKKKKKKDK